MRVVRNIVNTGRTIACTIHQPAIDIFEVRSGISHAWQWKPQELQTSAVNWVEEAYGWQPFYCVLCARRSV